MELFDSIDLRLAREEVLKEELGTAKSALMSVLLTGQLRVTPDDPNA